MLGEEDFDLKLVGIIRRLNRGKGRLIVLVFDGADAYGDKREAGDNVTVIYSPKDKFYRSADDKIVELVKRSIDKDLNFGYPVLSSLSIVTDDRELIKRVEKAFEESRRKLVIISAAGFAEKLRQKRKAEDETDIKDNNRGLDNAEINNINRELLDLWK